jgi:hypothetical protein
MAVSLYDELKELGAELDSHESDLYVKSSPEVDDFLNEWDLSMSRFRSQVDGCWWWDLPFMYEPWWQARAK